MKRAILKQFFKVFVFALIVFLSSVGIYALSGGHKTEVIIDSFWAYLQGENLIQVGSDWRESKESLQGMTEQVGDGIDRAAKFYNPEAVVKLKQETKALAKKMQSHAKALDATLSGSPTAEDSTRQ